jgi:hypothetical protein
MKKTAMQQLIDKYEKEAKRLKSPTIKYLLEMVLDDIKEMNLLETEREQIKMGYYRGKSDYKASRQLESEQYYKETYE